MKRTIKGRPAGMWILGGSSGHINNPAPMCARCGRADWADVHRHGTDWHPFEPRPETASE